MIDLTTRSGKYRIREYNEERLTIFIDGKPWFYEPQDAAVLLELCTELEELRAAVPLTRPHVCDDQCYPQSGLHNFSPAAKEPAEPPLPLIDHPFLPCPGNRSIECFWSEHIPASDGRNICHQMVEKETDAGEKEQMPCGQPESAHRKQANAD